MYNLMIMLNMFLLSETEQKRSAVFKIIYYLTVEILTNDILITTQMSCVTLSHHILDDQFTFSQEVYQGCTRTLRLSQSDLQEVLISSPLHQIIF